MTIGDYLVIFRRRRWLIAAVAVTGLLLGVVAGVLLPPQNRATSTIFVSASASGANTTFAYQGNLLSEQRVKSYTQLLSGTRITTAVVQQLALPETPGQLASEISASASPDTTLISLTVTDADPGRALLISNAIGDAFTQLVGQLEQPAGSPQPPAITARVVEPPVVASTGAVTRVLEDAVIGLLLGLAVGVGLALLRNALDNTVRDVESLREVTGASVLGSVSHSRSMADSPLALRDSSQLSRAEEYRQLRTTLQYVDVDRRRKVVLITSSVPSEGKTTTACNLAIALNRAGSSVVLVEGDLRRPRVADNFGLVRDVGLTSVLAHVVDLDSAVQRWGAENLDVLASGPLPPNPSELLGSGAMDELLSALVDRYDVVLVDAPPLLPVSDGTALAARCDGVVLVARYGKTSKAEIRHSLAALDRVGARFYGSVLSMTPDEHPESYGDYQVGDTQGASSAGRSLAPSMRASTRSAPSRDEDPDTDVRPALAVPNGTGRLESTATFGPRSSPRPPTNGTDASGPAPRPRAVNGARAPRTSGAHVRRERRN